MKPVTLRACHATGVLLAWTVLAAPAASQQPAIHLSPPDGPGITGSIYTAELKQAVRIGPDAGEAQVVREATIGFRFLDGRRLEDGRTRATVEVESVRAATRSPHGREVIDGRHLAGDTLVAVYGPRGGPVEWQTATSVLDLGATGDTLPLSALVEYLFPRLPAGPIRPGSSWTQRWRRGQVDGDTYAVAPAVTRFTLDRVADDGGRRVAHIGFVTELEGDGLEAEGSVVIDLDRGTIVRLILEERRRGNWDFGSTVAAFQQAATLTLTLADQDPVAPSRRSS